MSKNNERPPVTANSAWVNMMSEQFHGWLELDLGRLMSLLINNQLILPGSPDSAPQDRQQPEDTLRAKRCHCTGCKSRAQITNRRITITHDTSTGYSGRLIQSSVMCDCDPSTCDLCSGLASCAVTTLGLDSKQLLVTRCWPISRRVISSRVPAPVPSTALMADYDNRTLVFVQAVQSHLVLPYREDTPADKIGQSEDYSIQLRKCNKSTALH
ncbi:hypothetical protein J6590_052011 [Homalodisca vitripennis]|nr:hypothetical protein J6590_052011 [Homalodisca vitripennis]